LAQCNAGVTSPNKSLRAARVNFVADESVDGPIVDLLRLSGHSVVYIAEQEQGLEDDSSPAAISAQPGFIFLTNIDAKMTCTRRSRRKRMSPAKGYTLKRATNSTKQAVNSFLESADG